MTKKILLGLSTASSRDLSLFLSDGPWRGYPSLAKMCGPPFFFFSCIAGLVRDLVGQQLE